MTAMSLQHARMPAGGVHRRAPGHRLAHALTTLHEWRRRNRDRARLAAMDDRMLRDIGLTRAEASFLANKPFWRA